MTGKEPAPCDRGPRSFSLGRLLELFQVDEVADHLFRREVVEQAQHPLEQNAVSTAAELLGDDDARVRAAPCPRRGAAVQQGVPEPGPVRPEAPGLAGAAAFFQRQPTGVADPTRPNRPSRSTGPKGNNT